LLELSGIRDKDVLSSHGINTTIELPGVGENQFHGFAPVIVEVDGALETVEILRNPEGLAKHQALYQEQKGLLACFSATFYSFLPANIIGSRDDIADWEAKATLEASAPEVFLDIKPEVKRAIQKAYDVMRKFVNDPSVGTAQIIMFNGHFAIPGMIVDPLKRYLIHLNVYSHAYARGTAHIKSTSPTDPLSINPNYLSNPADLDIVVKTLRMTLELVKTALLRDLVVKNVVPSADATNGESKVSARDMMSTLFHPMSTCSMVPKEDGGVVDSKLLVYGTTNLRVVRSSTIRAPEFAALIIIENRLLYHSIDIRCESTVGRLCYRREGKNVLSF